MPSHTKFSADYLNHDGAMELVRKIKLYWSQRGHSPRVYLVQADLPRGAMPVFAVRSDLCNGWPT